MRTAAESVRTAAAGERSPSEKPLLHPPSTGRLKSKPESPAFSPSRDVTVAIRTRLGFTFSPGESYLPLCDTSSSLSGSFPVADSSLESFII